MTARHLLSYARPRPAKPALSGPDLDPVEPLRQRLGLPPEADPQIL